MHNSPMTAVGYARVSTTGQPLDAQLNTLTGAGRTVVYRETISGAHSDRRELCRVLDVLQPGNVPTVTRLDRLARSTRELFDTVETITSKGAALRSLVDTWADTTTPHGRFILTVLAGLAEFERHLIRERTGEVRARAKAQGTHLGRQRTLTPLQQQQPWQRRAAGETAAAIARSLNVSRSTASRVTS